MFVEILRKMTPIRALGFGIILMAFYYFLAFDSGADQENAINAGKAQIATLENQIRESQGKLDRAAVYKKTAAEVGTTIHKLLSVIPERFSSPDLMKILSNEAKVAGTSLLGIQPGQSEVSSVSKEFDEIPVSVDMDGSFLQHMVFLSNLTKINQILIVRKLELTSLGPGKPEEPSQVHMIAEIIAYRYHPAPETKPGEPAPNGGGK